MRTAVVDYLLPWPCRPFRCLLRLHMWRLHPEGHGWSYCRMCGAEKQTTR
jgi:hypothetical protein